MQMTSMFLKSCTRSNAAPIGECLCPVLQLSGLEGSTAAPTSQITAQEQAVCSLQPWAFPNSPFLSPSPILQSDSQSFFEAFSTKLFPVLWFFQFQRELFHEEEGLYDIDLVVRASARVLETHI